MITLVALLNVTQPLPWLDRNWINHHGASRDARRRKRVAFRRGAAAADLLPLHFAVPARAAIRHAFLGGPSGM